MEIKRSGNPSPVPTEQEKAHRAVSRKAAAEGFVLLKNDGVLPLCRERKIGLFGGGAIKLMKGGTGSGDVNEREVVSILDGMKNAGFTVTSENWLRDYEKRYDEARFAWRDMINEKAAKLDGMGFFFAYSTNPFRVPSGRPITEEDVDGAQTAVYVISRVAGEGADRMMEEGDYLLTDAERADLQTLCSLCASVVVLINTGAQIDMKDILSHEEVKAVAYICQPGMEGGNAVADVLSGDVNFSGKLTDTWTVDYSDFPNAPIFSHQNGNVEQEEYREDIYVGYRYFDTFDVPVVYPFGFGLSYTTFETAFSGVCADGESVTVCACVCNTGKAAGKEVVQVYAAAPQTGLPKERRRLVGFAKTKLLQPGESETVTVKFPMKSLASFCEKCASWVLEQGCYGLFVGNSIAASVVSAVLEVKERKVLETVSHICPMEAEIETITRPEAAALAFEEAWQTEAEKKGAAKLTLEPLGEKKCCKKAPSACELEAEQIVEQMSVEELAAMSIGNVSRGQGNALGSAGVAVPGSAGETANVLEEKFRVPGLPMADGPAGLRVIKQYGVDRETGNVLGTDFLSALEGGLFAQPLDLGSCDVYYQYCTSFPVGALLAQTWNMETLEAVGAAVGEEMLTLGVAWWLAPGMNIHRNPLCGRNFEYYAEDPVVSGLCAAAITRGVQKMGGVGTTIKHFACNNQEDNRMGSDSIVSERALREIYLRGFEIAVKTSQPMCIMSSYNRINGVHTANSYDLCTVAARQEWGFEGIIMTDWTTTSPHGGSLAWKCVAAGNDLIMPGAESDFESIHAALASGELKLEELKACAKRMLTVILSTAVCSDFRK